MDVRIDELNVFVPDPFVLDDVPPPDAQYVGVPRVVFEVPSPFLQARDRGYRTRHLLGLGVREVWLIDGEAHTVEVVDLGGMRMARGEQSARSRALPGFALRPDDLFPTQPDT